MPADFVVLAKVKCKEELKAHYRLSCSVLNRWLRETGVEAATYVSKGGGRPVRPFPADFPAAAPYHTREELMQRFDASADIVHRWLKEAGVEPKVARPATYAPRAPKVAPRRRSGGSPWGNTIAPAPVVSVADLAAQHLRRQHASVHRADIDPSAAKRAGLPNQGKGYHFVAGKGFMPTPDMIALAEQKGFDRQAWARI